jgi:hypothetical protein
MTDAPKQGTIPGEDPAEGRYSSRFVRPQTMRNLTSEARAEERKSTWLELFFDLCFVVAVAALARGLHHDPNVEGMLRFLGLFVPVWWSWMIFTWYATCFDNDDVPYRVMLFVAMLSILGLAASVGRIGVDAAAAVSFVLAYALMRLIVAGLFLRARRQVPAALRRFVDFYVAGNVLGAAIWLSSLLVPPPLRYVVWGLGLCVELVGPILAVITLDNPRVTFHPRHIAERYGLFTLIVLGESVLAVASGTAGTDWARLRFLRRSLALSRRRASGGCTSITWGPRGSSSARARRSTGATATSPSTLASPPSAWASSSLSRPRPHSTRWSREHYPLKLTVWDKERCLQAASSSSC